MVAKRYIPDRGELVWLDFNPIRGHEQSGRCPALVVSPQKYNAKSGLTLVCPVTSRVKGYPFEVLFTAKTVQGAVLADQIRTVDWMERHVKRIGTVSETVVAEVQSHLMKLIGE